MTRDEENRRLAEWLGFHRGTTESQHEVFSGWWNPEHTSWRDDPPDFYTDEAANALLLEKMPMPYLWLQRVETQAAPMWHCIADYEHIKFERAERDPDRKTAIVKCALAFLEVRHAS